MAPLKNYKLGLREKFLLNISKLEYSPFKLYLSKRKNVSLTKHSHIKRKLTTANFLSISEYTNKKS